MKETKLMECPVHGVTEHALYDGRYRCKKCYVYYGNEKRKRKKEELVKYKGGKCEICGYDKCIDALEFHHPDPNKKEFSLSDSTVWRSLDEMKKEADKCILVCANCHREIHWKERQEGTLQEKTAILKRKRPALSKIDNEQFKKYLREGKTQKEMAKLLGVSVSTIKRYKQVL